MTDSTGLKHSSVVSCTFRVSFPWSRILLSSDYIRLHGLQCICAHVVFVFSIYGLVAIVLLFELFFRIMDSLVFKAQTTIANLKFVLKIVC